MDLIYLDPPFNSNQFYVAAFGDKGMVRAQLRDIWRWTAETEITYRQRIPHGRLLECLQGIILQTGADSKMAAYCVYMGRRLAEMRRVLKPTGSIYLHCDPHANAYLRILMDAVFGTANFRNEVIWEYGLGGSSRRLWSRKHDTVFFYTKTDKYHFDKPSVPATSQRLKGQSKGMKDVWTDIPSLNNMAGERVGYPTQKPRALLERIIAASSNPGDLVLDPFCGCGTAADAAAALGRKYLGVDVSGIAVRVMQQRLESRGDAVAPVVYGLEWNDFDWDEFQRRALMRGDEAEDGIEGWAWAEDKVAGLLQAVPSGRKRGMAAWTPVISAPWIWTATRASLCRSRSKCTPRRSGPWAGRMRTGCWGCRPTCSGGGCTRRCP